MSVLTIGDALVDASLHDLEGNEHNLSDYNDKYMLVHFWSMTCMICMNAARELKVIHEKYSDNLNLIAINMDEEKARWEQGSLRDGIRWTNLSDGKSFEGGVGKIYSIAAYPAYVLFNPKGIIVDRWMGFKSGRFEDKMQEFVL